MSRSKLILLVALQVTGKNCRPYGDTNRMVHQQVLLDYGNGGNGGPPFHILLNGTVVPRGHSLYPQGAYKEYCCPCTSCSECAKYHTPCCDPLSNPNGQSIYKIHPHPVWAVHGESNLALQMVSGANLDDNECTPQKKIWRLHEQKQKTFEWIVAHTITRICRQFGNVMQNQRIACLLDLLHLLPPFMRPQASRRTEATALLATQRCTSSMSGAHSVSLYKCPEFPIDHMYTGSINYSLYCLFAVWAWWA